MDCPAAFQLLERVVDRALGSASPPRAACRACLPSLAASLRALLCPEATKAGDPDRAQRWAATQLCRLAGEGDLCGPETKPLAALLEEPAVQRTIQHFVGGQPAEALHLWGTRWPSLVAQVQRVAKDWAQCVDWSDPPPPLSQQLSALAAAAVPYPHVFSFGVQAWIHIYRQTEDVSYLALLALWQQHLQDALAQAPGNSNGDVLVAHASQGHCALYRLLATL
eukprot:EG_transcript_28602